MKLIPINRCTDCEFFLSVCNDIHTEVIKADETCFSHARCGVCGKSLINFELPELYREFPYYDSMDYIRSIPDWCPKKNRQLRVSKCVQCINHIMLEVREGTYNRCPEIDGEITDVWSIHPQCPYKDE
jgi:hypothetical protein